VKTDKRQPKREEKRIHSRVQNQQPIEGTRLNKYIASTGYCSRRNADELIFAGLVTVNGSPMIEPGYQVKPGDRVVVEGKKIRQAQKYYVLLNKTRDAITTTSDERGRKTVMALVRGACDESIYPVGRLDRNTTGLLLLTNDGELANRLMHPAGEVRKVYKVRLEREVPFETIKKIRNGVMLEDGLALADEANHIKGEGGENVMLVMHSGRNRIVRRIFEALGFKVMALDRVGYAGLTLHGLGRGEWRYLTNEEVKTLFKKTEHASRPMKKTIPPPRARYGRR
jgi:23S rRNA pseudouridine2605 synthase